MMARIYNKHKETIHNFTWRSLQIFGKHGVTFLIFILCAKLLTPYDFGIYNYALAIIFFLIIFGDFGISSATSKYVAEYNTTNKEKLKYVLFNSGLVILILTVLVSILTILIGPLYFKERYVYILYLLPLVFLAPMTSLYDGIYRGLKQFKKLAIISLIVGIFSISFVYIFVKQYGLVGALISQNFFYAILLISLGFGYREFSFKLNKHIIKEIGKYSFIIGLGSIGYLFYTRIDVILLEHFNYIEEISYFELINKLIMAVGTLFFILGQVTAPNITRNIILKNYESVRKKYIKSIIFSFSCGLIISIILYLFIPYVIKSFLLEYYNNSLLNILRIIIFITPLTFVSQFMSECFIVATGKARYNLLTIPFGILNIFLTYLFIQFFGYIGAAYSLLIITTANRILTWTLLYRRFLKDEKASK